MDAQNPVVLQPQPLQHFPGEQDVLLGVGGLVFPEDIRPGHAAVHGHPGKPVCLRLRQEVFGVPAKAAGEQDFGGIAL